MQKAENQDRATRMRWILVFPFRYGVRAAFKGYKKSIHSNRLLLEKLLPLNFYLIAHAGTISFLIRNNLILDTL